MIFSMAGFAIEDAIIKKLSDTLPLSQVLISIGFAGLLVFFILSLITKTSLISSQILRFSFFFRMLCELVSSILFVFTIVFVSLSVSSAILQITPIFVVLGGIFFFKQKVFFHHWLLIFLGFFGVLMIVQPGMKTFNPLALMAIIGALFLAFRDLATRSMSNSIPAITIAFWGFFSLTIGGFFCLPIFEPLQPFTLSHSFLIILSSFFGPLAYLTLVFATRVGDVAVISPYRYIRLPFALILGFFFFDEKPNLLMLTGCFLIVISGVLILVFSKKVNENLVIRKFKK